MVCVAWVAVSCQGEFVPSDEDERLPRGQSLDAGRDCGWGWRSCDDACRDLSTNPEHCGACAAVCESGLCASGRCVVCRSDEVVCNGACVNLASDAAHCGACATPCALDQVCAVGSCESACPEGLADCNAGCVDLDLDVRHCGDCGVSCAANAACSDGHCRADCRAPLIECEGLCRDPRTDPRNCGGCGVVCSPSRSGAATTCLDGECVPHTENCHNGLDDNDDGLHDCEDPSCREAARCLPRSPAGWSEPFVLVTGDAGNPPECVAPFDVAIVTGLHQDLSSVPAACTCQCTTTARCEVTIWFYDDVACLNDPWEVSGVDALASGVCEVVYFEREGTEGAVSIWPQITAERQSDANTECSLTAPALEPPAWALDSLGCAPEISNPAGCNVGTCVPSGGVRYCVAQQGMQSCPPGFPEKQLMHTDYIDERGCGPCECEFECPETFSGYTDEQCGVDGEDIDAELPCAALTPDATPEVEDELVWETRSFRVAPPSCEPLSQPLGAATPSGSVTVCCEGD
jgi:hypothetical protein